MMLFPDSNGTIIYYSSQKLRFLAAPLSFAEAYTAPSNGTRVALRQGSRIIYERSSLSVDTMN